MAAERGHERVPRAAALLRGAVAGLVGRRCGGVLRASNGIELFFESPVPRGTWSVLDAVEIGCRWRLAFPDGRVLVSETIPDVGPGAPWPRPALFPGLEALTGLVLVEATVGAPVLDLRLVFEGGAKLEAWCVEESPWVDWALVVDDVAWQACGASLSRS